MARVFRNERLEIACHAVIVGLIVYQAATFYALRLAKRGQAEMDFLAFHVAGTMWRHGQAAAAYDTARFTAGLNDLAPTGTMHWAYPPPMFLLGGLLSLLPVWAAYLAFTLPGYLAFVAMVRRLAGAYAPGAVALAVPAMIINARNGQTGFWIAAAQGWFVLAMLGRRSTAGVPLGMLALKPHLAVGLGFGAVVQRHWRIVVIAALVALALGAVATLALGPGIWPAFLEGSRKASLILRDGNFPLTRMTSVYAFVLPSGMAPSVALAVHVLVLAAALAGVAWGRYRNWPERAFWASAAFAGILVSPYVYDYDLVVLAVVGALVLPGLCAISGSVLLAALLVFCWLAGANFALMNAQLLYWGYIAPVHGKVMLISVSAPFLLLTALLCGWSFARQAGKRGAGAWG